MQLSPDYRLAGVCVYWLLTSSRVAEWRSLVQKRAYAYIRVNYVTILNRNMKV